MCCPYVFIVNDVSERELQYSSKASTYQHQANDKQIDDNENKSNKSKSIEKLQKNRLFIFVKRFISFKPSMSFHSPIDKPKHSKCQHKNKKEREIARIQSFAKEEVKYTYKHEITSQSYESEFVLTSKQHTQSIEYGTSPRSLRSFYFSPHHDKQNEIK